MQASRRLCREARERIGRAFDGSLSVEERFALEEHSAGCERCAGELARVQLLNEALLRMPEAPLGGLDVEAAARAVRARIDEQGTAKKTPVPRGRWIAAAAAVVLGLAWWSAAGDELDGERGEARVVAELEAEPEVESGAGGQGDAGLDAGFDAGPDESEVGLVRRTAALASLRGLLDLELGGHDPEAVEAAWTEAFLERSQVELGAGWLIEGLLRELVGDRDGRMASAALRGLAAMGGRMAVADVERALAEPGRMPAAAQALVDLGAVGQWALARAWWRPEVRELVQGRLLDWDGAARREFVQRALLGRHGEVIAASAALAALLVDTGEEGLRDLVELGVRGDLDQAALVAALAQADGELATEVLLAAADERGGRDREPFLLAAAGGVRGDALLYWVLDRAERGRHRELVAGALAMFDAPRARAGLMQLEASRRVEPGAFLEAWRVAVRRNPGGMREYAEGLGVERGTAARLLELCVASEETAALGAGFALCGAGILPATVRRDALLALGEQCGEAQLAQLERLFATLKNGDAPVAAAVVLVVHRIGGELASARLLGNLPVGVLDRVLKRLASASGSGRSALYTLSYLLESTLAARTPLASLDNLELR